MNYFDIFTEPLGFEPKLFGLFAVSPFIFYLTRFIIGLLSECLTFSGVLIIFPIRIILKKVLTKLIRSNFPTTFEFISHYERPLLEQTLDFIAKGSKHKESPKAAVDLPVKYISYIIISSSLIILCPLVFGLLGMGSPVECAYYLAKMQH